MTGRLLALLMVTLLLVAAGCAKNSLPAGSKSSEVLSLPLQRGDFPVRRYEPPSVPRALVVFGSGDGGWKSWEERTCRTLALAGFRVIGWDCRAYAAKPYDAEILGRDLQQMAKKGEAGAATNSAAIPVFYGGYSTGAEQAVAAAAWALRKGASSVLPQGLLLVAPGERSRYGITTSDLMGIPPHGVGSFAVRDLAPTLSALPVAQIHGTLDPLDSTEWLARMEGPHRLYTIKAVGHSYGDAGSEFLYVIVEAARWLLHQVPKRS